MYNFEEKLKQEAIIMRQERADRFAKDFVEAYVTRRLKNLVFVCILAINSSKGHLNNDKQRRIDELLCELKSIV